MTDARLAAIAGPQHGVFATWQLAGIGVSARAVLTRARDGRLRRLYRGVYATGPYVSVRGQWLAATLARGPRAALSHRAAASLWDLIEWRGGAIDVTVPGGGSRRQRGLRSHTAIGVQPCDLARIDAIPVTSLARTLLDLASVLTPTKLRRAYERAERLEVLDLAGITELLGRANGHRGAGKLGALLAYDPGLAAQAESELERIFLDLLRAHAVAMPQVNVLVDGYLVDAYWPEANLVVELDGYEFHHDRDVFERDHRKIATLRLGGREVLPLTYEQVTREPDWVIATTVALLERGRRAVGAVSRP